MIRAYKTEIDFTDNQKQQFLQNIGVCRFLYNKFIDMNKESYKSGKGFISGYDFDKYVNNELSVEFPWIKDCGSKARKKAIMSAEKAFKRFFKRLSDFPVFKSRKKQDVKLYFPKNHSSDLLIERHKIKIPTFGWIRLKEYGYLPVGAKAICCYVSVMADRYFVSVHVEDDGFKKITKLNNVGIGIDLGIKDTAIINDGHKFKNINKTSKIRALKKRLKREQRKLSRKNKNKKGESAKNRAKQVLKIQKIYKRIANIRTDYLRKIVIEIVKSKPSFITIEDLNIKGMMKNRHLSKAISEQKLSELKTWLIWKCKQYGIELRQVDRFYPSSKICSQCGSIKSDLKLSDRTYRCSDCGFVCDRDVNAGINLKNAREYRIAA